MEDNLEVIRRKKVSPRSQRLLLRNNEKTHQDMGEIAIIFNPSSGKGKAARKKPILEAYLKANRIRYKMFVTQSEEHLVRTAAQVARDYQVIVGAGGDTTITLIASQIIRLHRGNTLGVIGLGSINDLAREIGVLRLDQACAAIKAGHIIDLDVGVINSRLHDESTFFLVQASLGLGVTINRYVVDWMKKHSLLNRFSSMTQPFVAISGFYHSYRNNIVPVRFDLKQANATNPIYSPFVIFYNTSVCAREFRLSPHASPVDGKLDCCVIHAPTLPHFIQGLIQFKRQKNQQSENVSVFRDDKFTIHSPHPLEIQIDGEIHQTDGRIEVSTRPRAIKLLVNPRFTRRFNLQPRSGNIVQESLPLLVD